MECPSSRHISSTIGASHQHLLCAAAIFSALQRGEPPRPGRATSNGPGRRRGRKDGAYVRGRQAAVTVAVARLQPELRARAGSRPGRSRRRRVRAAGC